MNCCYILFSPSLNRFYIGITHDNLEERIAKHNSRFYKGNHFTAKANDWELYIKIEVDQYKNAMWIEKKIKSMKSRRYIENLKKYPEIIDKLR
jgi:putative endonuclease